MTELKGLTSAALVGCTGLLVGAMMTISFRALEFGVSNRIVQSQGSHILSALISSSPGTKIHAISRSKVTTESPQITNTVNRESSEWPSLLKKFQPAPKAFITALGTTKAQAGSIEAQRAIDYDLNLALAHAAKEAGTEICVLVSSAGVSTSSPFPYAKMKAELEEAMKEVGFKYTVIVRPGMLVGDRSDSRPAEAVFRGVAKCLGGVRKKWLTDWWAQDVDVIGRAVVMAAIQCAESKREPGIWQIEQPQIIKLGRTEGAAVKDAST